MNEPIFSLTQLINQWIAERPKKEFTCWRASQLGMCPRSHFYKRLGVEPLVEQDERKSRVFSAGDVFHKWVQDIYFSTLSSDKTKELTGKFTKLLDGAGVEQEIYDKELDLGGRYDLLAVEGGKRILFDLKTQNSQKFWRIEQQGGEADKHHQVQLGTYMLMLKRAGTPVDEGRILYISKDDLATKEITYHLTPELEQKVLDEVNLLNEHWKNKTLPPCTCEGENAWLREKGYCFYSRPDKYEYKEVESKSGRKYKTKILTHCCEPALAEGKLINKEE